MGPGSTGAARGTGPGSAAGGGSGEGQDLGTRWEGRSYPTGRISEPPRRRRRSPTPVAAGPGGRRGTTRRRRRRQHRGCRRRRPGTPVPHPVPSGPAKPQPLAPSVGPPTLVRPEPAEEPGPLFQVGDPGQVPDAGGRGLDQCGPADQVHRVRGRWFPVSRRTGTPWARASSAAGSCAGRFPGVAGEGDRVGQEIRQPGRRHGQGANELVA